MLGKTHMAVGVSASLLFLQPRTLSEMVLGTGAAVIGSVISDIDIGTSDSHKGADHIIAITTLTIIITVIAECVWHIGIYQKFVQNSSLMHIFPSAALFLLICAFGKEQPHRSFMHSFLAFGLLTGCVDVFLPLLAPYFGIAFLSHLTLDVFNRRRERLLYPLKKGFCLNLCSSKGMVNQILFRAGFLLSVGLLGFRLSRIYSIF